MYINVSGSNCLEDCIFYCKNCNKLKLLDLDCSFYRETIDNHVICCDDCMDEVFDILSYISDLESDLLEEKDR